MLFLNKLEKIMDLEIQHDKERKKFFTLIDGREAYLTYRNNGDNILIFDHTYVPFNLRGQNIAGKIVKFALDYAKENNFKIIPACSYVHAYIDKNQQFNDLVEK
jgi:uncharacterized protein